MDKKIFYIPAAIIIAGLIIAGALIFTRKPVSAPGLLNNSPSPTPESTGNVNVVSDKDHIRGDINAPLTIIEYSDTECPFCKKFQETMQQLMDVYGKEGKIKWVYRHFPLDALHTKSRKESEATECAAELGGNEKFWAYLDRIYEITPSNDGLDPKQLLVIAEYLGLDKKAFEDCLNSGRHAQDVEDNYQKGLKAGVQGTPFSIIITKDNEQIPINGALPYSQLKIGIDQLLAEGS
ncbi:MAG: DsbA family protein [Patescibacteria group bacterium]